jgi:2,5-dihydroxypyridine 5,6-dioxygenase
VDCTVEGIIHSPEKPRIHANGTRMLFVSNDHPESLERTRPDLELKTRIQKSRAMMASAKHLHITTAAGTDFHVEMEGALVGGNIGFVQEPKQWASWPGGIQSCFPRAGAVNGVIVMNAGDVNFTFKRYLESPVTLVIENDFVTEIRGDGWDAELMRSYFEAWNDKNAYGASHVSWGMNHGARWDSLMMYDKGDVNATEGRAVAGTFLYSTGANPAANRFTLGHYDLTIRNCTFDLDGKIIIDRGKLCDELS